MALGSSNITSSENLLQDAATKDPSDMYLDLYAQAELIDLQRQLQATGATSLDTTTGTIYNNALTAAIQATQVEGPYNYRNWLFLGNVYEIGAELGVSKSATYARDAFVIAEQLAPANPLPFFVTGQLYGLGHDYPDAINQIQEALSLKPNYTDASSLLNNLTALSSSVISPVSSGSASSTASSRRTTVSSSKK